MDTMLENSDLYDFKMALFDNDKPKEFLLLIWNFNITIKALVMLKVGANIQYLCMIVRVEALRQFGMFFAEVGSATPENLPFIILGLGKYCFPVNALSDQKQCLM